MSRLALETLTPAHWIPTSSWPTKAALWTHNASSYRQALPQIAQNLNSSAAEAQLINQAVKLEWVKAK